MPFAVQPNDPLIEQLRAEAQARYPQEACGLIVAVGKKTKFMPCRNISHLPNEQFVMSPEDWIKAAEMGEVVALWHSHPNGNCKPSEPDRAGCEASQIPWLISAVHKSGEYFTHFGPELVEPSGFEADYIGRPYVFGVFDCYVLVGDYYKREFGIELDRLPQCRIPEWWKHGHDFFGEHYAGQGFVEVTDESWKAGDLLLFSSDSAVPNHIAVYVTSDIILHHVIGRLSRREPMGTFWRTRITHHIRHHSQC